MSRGLSAHNIPEVCQIMLYEFEFIVGKCHVNLHVNGYLPCGVIKVCSINFVQPAESPKTNAVPAQL